MSLSRFFFNVLSNLHAADSSEGSDYQYVCSKFVKRPVGHPMRTALGMHDNALDKAADEALEMQEGIDAIPARY